MIKPQLPCNSGQLRNSPGLQGASLKRLRKSPVSLTERRRDSMTYITVRHRCVIPPDRDFVRSRETNRHDRNGPLTFQQPRFLHTASCHLCSRRMLVKPIPKKKRDVGIVVPVLEPRGGSGAMVAAVAKRYPSLHGASFDLAFFTEEVWTCVWRIASLSGISYLARVLTIHHLFAWHSGRYKNSLLM